MVYIHMASAVYNCPQLRHNTCHSLNLLHLLVSQDQVSTHLLICILALQRVVNLLQMKARRVATM
jgi:hypothetical protein